MWPPHQETLLPEVSGHLGQPWSLSRLHLLPEIIEQPLTLCRSIYECFARMRISKPPSRRAVILGEISLPIDRGPRAILLFIESAGSSTVAAVISEATIA